MALISYFNSIRLNEDINNIMANIEWEMFGLDAPTFEKNYVDKKEDKAKAERLAHKIHEILEPTFESYNKMLIRNIKALRDLKRGNILLNIQNINQMNISEKQVNIEETKAISQTV